MRKSCNVATTEFISQVESIEPSDTGWLDDRTKKRLLNRPCRLILKDGRIVPRAICFEVHHGLRTDKWIHPDTVLRIEESPERLPAHLASKLYAYGESGMGYLIFRMKMKDGTFHVFITNKANDFPDYPDRYTAKDVEDVYPGEGREQLKYGHRGERTFEDCHYMKK